MEETRVRVTVDVGVGNPRQLQALVIALQAMFLRTPGAPAQIPGMLILAGIDDVLWPRSTRSRLLTAEGMQVVIVVSLDRCQTKEAFYWTCLSAYVVEYSVAGSAVLVKVETVVGAVM